jgi:hypothetical protein
MNFLLGILMLTSFQQKDSLARSYQHHTQSCHISGATNYYCNLKLLDDSTFSFIATSTEKYGISLPKHLNRSDSYSGSTCVSGRWEQRGDTLVLSRTIAFGKLMVFVPEKTEFLIHPQWLQRIEGSLLVFPGTMTAKN